jgi:hypothetical protein
MGDVLKRYSKAGGAAVGGAVALLVFVLTGADVSEDVEKVVTVVASLLGTYFAPPNS